MFISTLKILYLHSKKILLINVGADNLSFTSRTKVYINLEILETSVFTDQHVVYFLLTILCFKLFYSICKFILASLCYNHREVKNDRLIEELPRQFKPHRTIEEDMNN